MMVSTQDPSNAGEYAPGDAVPQDNNGVFLDELWPHERPAGFAARGESLAAFDGRCIPAGCVAPRSNTPGILGRRALPAGRLARLGATPDFHHGLLARTLVEKRFHGRRESRVGDEALTLEKRREARHHPAVLQSAVFEKSGQRARIDNGEVVEPIARRRLMLEDDAQRASEVEAVARLRAGGVAPRLDGGSRSADHPAPVRKRRHVGSQARDRHDERRPACRRATDARLLWRRAAAARATARSARGFARQLRPTRRRKSVSRESQRRRVVSRRARRCRFPTRRPSRQARPATTRTPRPAPRAQTCQVIASRRGVNGRTVCWLR